MSEMDRKSIIEAAIFACDEPITVERLLSLFSETERLEKAELQALLESLAEDYQGRGIELQRIASGYRFQAKADFAPWLQRLWEKKPPRYSRAILETLALIAYKQPITRGEIESVRGVAVSSQIVKTLLDREWVKVIGHKEVPGRPALLATTTSFLDYFNLSGLSDLPPLPEVVDLDTAGAQLGEQLALSAEKTAQDFVGPLPPSIIDEPNFADTHGKEDIDIAALAEQVLESTVKKPLAETTVEPIATTLEDSNHSAQPDDSLKVSAVVEDEQLDPSRNQSEPSLSETSDQTQTVDLERDTVVEKSREEMLV